MGEYTEKQSVQLRQKQHRDTHPEREVGRPLFEKESGKEVVKSFTWGVFAYLWPTT